MDDDNRITITVCGDGGCGKSSITLRLVRSQWVSEYDPTIEDSYTVSRTVDGSTYQLHLTDTAGQEEYRGLFSTSNLHSDAFLLVYDITQGHSLEALTYFNDLIQMETDTRLDKGGMAPVKMVVGNKCDLANMDGMRRIGAEEGLTWARRHGAGFMETSARERVNIEQTFSLIVRRVVEARKRHAQGLQAGGALQGHSAARTEPLTPMDEKDNPTNRQLGQTPSAFKAFLRKLNCFR